MPKQAPLPPLVKCEGCGRDIWWAVTLKGARIPMDPHAEVRGFIFQRGPGDGVTIKLQNTWKSHWATCPKAAQFRADNRDALAAK